jgi:predicted PurR-regulated permease PerM
MNALEVTPRQRRWLDALIVLATVIAFFVAAGLVGSAAYAFGDIIMIFFLAWLIAFMVGPLANGVVRLIPRLPRSLAVVIVYTGVFVVLLGVLFFVADALVRSINDFVDRLPEINEDLAALLEPIQEWLTSLGLSVDIEAQLSEILALVQQNAVTLLGPLQEVAAAAIGVTGNLLMIVVLSVYIAIDRERIAAFLARLVPPRYGEEAALLQTSVYRSFGGFIRGQLLLGFTYGLIAFVTSLALGLDFTALTSLTVGLLMAIPFFGPFIAWAPPVLAAIVSEQGAIVPALFAMGAGWFVVMNVLQPRLMAGSVGLHPIVVLASVIIGAKVAGIAGAIFGIPIAAIISAFFMHHLGRQRSGTVTERAARRVEDREGRPVRLPREPAPGLDADIEPDDVPDHAAGAAIAWTTEDPEPDPDARDAGPATAG